MAQVSFKKLMKEARRDSVQEPFIVDLPDGTQAIARTITAGALERLTAVTTGEAETAYDVMKHLLSCLFEPEGWVKLEAQLRDAPVEVTFKLADAVATHFFVFEDSDAGKD